MTMWFSIAIQVLTGLIALAALWKDWNSYGAISKRFGKRLPIFLAVFIVLAVSFTIRQTWVAVAREAKSAGHIEELGNQLKRNEEGAERRARQQLESFQGIINDLNRRLSDLQTKMNTDPLLRQNAALLKEIQDIRVQVNATKARIEQPLEKAELVATFSDHTSLPPEPDQSTLHKITVPRQADDTVEFTITVVNRSKVQARTGSIFVRLCRKCSFVKEPPGFKKAQGTPEYDRYTDMDNLPAGVAMQIPLKVKPPPLSSGFEVDVMPRCENCTVNAASKLFVDIER
jgi:hypothetical protein